MYNYLLNFQPVLLRVPLQLGALSARLFRLWVNPALKKVVVVAYDAVIPQLIRVRKERYQARHPISNNIDLWRYLY